MISLYEQHIIQLGAPAEEDIWQEIIEWRVKADDAKRAAQVCTNSSTIPHTVLFLLNVPGALHFVKGGH